MTWYSLFCIAFFLYWSSKYPKQNKFIWYAATKDVFPEVVVVSALRMDGSPEMWVLPLVWYVYRTGLNEGYWTTLTYILHWSVEHKRQNSHFADMYACFGPLLREVKLTCIFQNSFAFYFILFAWKSMHIMSCIRINYFHLESQNISENKIVISLSNEVSK